MDPRVKCAGDEYGRINRKGQSMANASTHVFRVSLEPKLYRDIEIPSDKTLYDLAAAIVAAYSFYFDHPFGFYSLLKGHIFSSPVKYELFADMDDIADR